MKSLTNFIFSLLIAASSLHGIAEPTPGPQVSPSPVASPSNPYVENEYGNEQVEALLRSRPNMKNYPSKKGRAQLTPQDSLWVWTAKQFEQRSYGKKIYWDSRLPKTCELSENNPVRGFIRLPSKVRCGPLRGQPLGFQTLWSDAIFELCDIGIGLELNDVDARARKGKLTKEKYIRSIGKLEYSCWKKKCETFEQVFKFWARTHDFKIAPKIWNCPVTISVNKALALQKNSANGWWHHYEDIYDYNIIPSIKRRGFKVPR